MVACDGRCRRSVVPFGNQMEALTASFGPALLVVSVARGEGAMTESSAAAAIQTTLSLPTLRQGQGPPGAVGRLQHIFNDFAKADDDPRIFDESGVFGPKTN